MEIKVQTERNDGFYFISLDSERLANPDVLLSLWLDDEHDSSSIMFKL